MRYQETMLRKLLPLLAWWSAAAGSLEVRTGWLDRLVSLYKTNFLNDLVAVAPVEVKVSMQPAPPGYVDSPDWDYDSVTRLINLIRGSDAEQPLKELVEDLVPQPSRRYLGMGRIARAKKMAAKRRQMCAGDPHKPGYPNRCKLLFNSRKNNGKAVKALGFKSRKQGGLNRIYVPSYTMHNDDLYYDEMMPIEEFNITRPNEGHRPWNDTVVYISNPVEAKLPSGRISVQMLREILEARAEAARVMPTTENKFETTTGTGSDQTGQSGDTGATDTTTDIGAATTADDAVVTTASGAGTGADGAKDGGANGGVASETTPGKADGGGADGGGAAGGGADGGGAAGGGADGAGADGGGADGGGEPSLRAGKQRKTGGKTKGNAKAIVRKSKPQKSNKDKKRQVKKQ